MNESGILDIQHEVLDSNDFDNDHPSSPFFVQSLPRHLDKLSPEEIAIEARNMGINAAKSGVGQGKNPFNPRDYPTLYTIWRTAWYKQTISEF